MCNFISFLSLGILKGADLDNLSTKKIRKQLEKEFDTDLTKRFVFLRCLEMFNALSFLFL